MRDKERIAMYREEEMREMERGRDLYLQSPPPSMPVPDEQGDGGGDQQQLARFDPEAEGNEPEDLQETVEKKDEDDEEVKRVNEAEEKVVEEEEDKEDGDEGADEEKEEEGEEEEEEDEEEPKEKTPSTTSGDKSEFMEIDLGEIRKDVQCPICLGVIKKTRTVMECLHRFCRECIDKSMRLGNNECPACRKHCASRRSLRDDPTFDALIAALFTNIDSYEEEEFAFHEDDKARNKQIQASIAEISQRQSEALVKRKSFGKESAVLMRSQRSGSVSRRRRNSRNMEQNADEDDDNNEDNNNNNNGGGEDSSSDERGAEVRLKKRRKRSASRSTQHPSSSGANNNGDKDTEGYRDSSRGISPGLVWNPEMLAWGRSATRSNPRHENNTAGGSSKSLRNARINKLVEYLRSNLDGNIVEEDINLKLVSLDTKCVPDLPQPYLRCRVTLLVKQLREFVALQTHLKTEEVELLVTRGLGAEDKTVENLTVVASASAFKDEMRSLEDNEALSRLKTDFNSSHEQHLTIAYRKKQTE